MGTPAAPPAMPVEGPPGEARGAESGACGLAVADIAIYQGVKVTLARGGKEVRPRPDDIVQRRPALVRVFLKADASFTPGPVAGSLTLTSAGGSKVLVDERKLGGSSTDADLGSTLDFDVPAELLGDTVSYAFELTAPSACAAVRFPAQKTASFSPRRVGVLKIKLVPIRYGADGSDRLPDTSDVQLAAMRARILAQFPVEALELSLHAPVRSTLKVTGAGETWETLLDSIRDLRAADHAEPDVFYFGLVSPADTLVGYCPDQCYLGLSFRTDKPVSKYQAGVGVGFSELAASVLAHELGHMAGRKHSPCKVTSYLDPQYPVADGKTGSWGWDARSRSLYPPESTSDLMGYCSPAWISDYTYDAVLDRFAEVMGGNRKASLEASVSGRALLVSGGRGRWGLPAEDDGEGAPVPAVVRDQAGAVVATLEVRRLELGEGDRFTVLIPQAQPGWHTIEVAGAAPLRFDEPTVVSALQE